MGNNQSQQLSDVIKRRNEQLEQFFRDCNVPIRIIGDPQKPAFVYDEIAFLSMYVSNFDMHFNFTHNGEGEVARVKLRKNHEMSHDDFMGIIAQCTHKAVIKIKLAACTLCVSGYNFLDRSSKDGRYPVFARHGHKTYFKKGYADSLVSELNADGYNVVTWIPGQHVEHELKIEVDVSDD